MIRPFVKLGALAMSVFVVAHAVAQNVIPGDMRGQPLVYVKEGKIYGCGIRFILVDVPQNLGDQSVVSTYDLSFNLYMPIHPVVKGGSYDVTAADFKRGNLSKVKPIAPSTIWLKADGARATAPQMGHITKSDDPGFFLYTTDLDPILALFGAFNRKEVILVGTKRPGARSERVFSGSIEMEPAERERVSSCIVELLADFKK
jgi:hypothetical protein